MLTIADTSEVFGAIHAHPDGGSPVLIDLACDRVRAVSGGWLNRHWREIHDLWVSTERLVVIGRGWHEIYRWGPRREHNVYGPASRAGRERRAAVLAARMTNGKLYVSNWADQSVLHDALKRPTMLGRPVHWNCHSYITGDRDYERMAWERRKRQERERAYRAAHPDQFSAAA